MAVVNKDLGVVTAYAYAVAGGYVGTEEEFTEALGQAGITLEQLENLTAVAVTLTPGSEATASYSDGVLTFGIPQGAKGDKGDKGDKGNKGDTGNGIVSITKAGTSGLVDTYMITFTDGTTTTFIVTNGADGDITNVAEAFDSTKAYSVGDMVLYQGTLYAFTVAHSAGAWVGSDAQAVILAEVVADLKSDLSVFETNTFVRPTDYGKLVDASDCETNKPDDITIANSTSGIVVTMTGRVNATVTFNYNDIPTASEANPETYDLSITISDLTYVDEVYLFDHNTEIGRYANGTGLVTKNGNTFKIRYTYPNQSTIRWRVAFSYKMQNHSTTITNLSGLNINEPWKIIPDTIDWYLNVKYGSGFNAPSSGLKVIKTTDGLWSQGACTVGDYYIGFVAGSDDHSTNGKMNIGLFSDMPNYQQANQNLGHCASADYDENTDTMLVGNGTSDTSIPAVVYLVKNASSIAENKTDVLYNGANVVEITMSGLDGGSCVACFGECNDIIYVVTGDTETQAFSESNTKYIYRCLLGKGDNNLQTAFQSNSYGTFISGCGENEYNGTLHILNEYQIAFAGELQGLKYVNGSLLFPTDNYTNSILTSYLVYVKLQSAPIIEKVLWIPVVSTSGELVRTECEDVIFHDGKGYVMTNTTVGASHTYKTHIFDC